MMRSRLEFRVLAKLTLVWTAVEPAEPVPCPQVATTELVSGREPATGLSPDNLVALTSHSSNASRRIGPVMCPPRQKQAALCRS